MKSVKRIALAAAALLVLVSVGAAVRNARAITKVSVQVRDAAGEHRDLSVLGIGKADALPDYRLEIVERGGRRTPLAVRANTSAKDPIEWTVPDPVSVRDVVSLRLVDQDPGVDDVLDEVQVDGERLETERYTYGVTTERTLDAGLRSFVETPVGLALALGIGAAVFLSVLLELLS